MPHKKQAGFTLVELMVTLAVASIVLVAAGGIMISSSNLFTNQQRRSEDKQIGDAVFAAISEEIIYATNVRLSQVSAGGAECYLDTLFGQLRSSAKDVFGSEFYHGRTVSMQLSANGSYGLDLTVTVLDEDNAEVYAVASTLQLLNQELSGIAILEEEPGKTVSCITYMKGDKSGG